MIRVFAFLFMLTVSYAAFADGTVAGRVFDATTGEPLVGTNVVVVGTAMGSVTDADGRFEIADMSPGSYVVRADFIGYDSFEEAVEVTDGERVDLRFALSPTAIEMGEIETVGDFDAVVRREEDRPSTRRLESAKLRSIAGTAGDLSRGLASLPGVITGGDYSAQLFVRGGGPDQNEVLVDGVPITTPYHMGMFISSFNPDMVEDLTLYPGGFPARWGNRLSAVLDVRLREGSDSFSVLSSTSLLNTSVLAEGPLPGGDGTYIVGVRRTYYDLVLNAVSDEEVAYPFFTDLTAKVTFRTSARTRIRFVGYADDEGFDMNDVSDDENPDSVEIDMTNSSSKGFVSAEFVAQPSASAAFRTRASYLFRNEDFDIDGDFGVVVDVKGRRFSLSEEAAIKAGVHEFDIGAEYHRTHADFGWHFIGDDSLRYDHSPGEFNPFVPTQSQYEYDGSWVEAGGWVSDRFPLSSRFSVEAGARADYSNITRNMVVSPRSGFSYDLDPLTTLRASVGIYRQFPNYEIYSEKGYFPEFDRNPDITAEQSIHYLFGLDMFVTSRWRLKAEGYYRDMSKLVINEDTTLVPVNIGEGEAYGAEFYLEKRALPDARLSGWVSYTLSKTVLRDPWNGEYDAPYDQRHTVNLVFDYSIYDWLSVGGTWRFGSGFPYTDVVGVNPVLLPDTTDPAAPPDTLDWEPIWGETNGERYPVYHRLDLRVSFEYSWLGAAWTAYVEALNVYNRKNVYTYAYDRRYTERRTTHELPLLPSFGFTLHF